MASATVRSVVAEGHGGKVQLLCSLAAGVIGAAERGGPFGELVAKLLHLRRPKAAKVRHLRPQGLNLRLELANLVEDILKLSN